MSESRLVNTLLRSWQFIYVVAVPVILLPLPFYMNSKAGLSAYVMLWMSFYWTAEPIPLPVTALMPLVLFPLFGVLTTAQATKLYFNDIGFVMFGALVVAAAIEVSNLHQRLALRALLAVGTSNRRLLLGFMLFTMFISMWISNTASASIMVPIVMAVMDHLQILTKEAQVDAGTSLGPVKSPAVQVTSPDEPAPVPVVEETTPVVQERTPVFEEVTPVIEDVPPAENESQLVQMRKVMLLSVAYAANIGGTGSLIGTGANLVLQALYIELFKQDDLTFLSWMLYNVPPMLVCTFLAWIYIQQIVAKLTPKGMEQDSREKIRQELERRYSNLGAMRFQEAAALFFTCGMILLLLTQNPRIFPGWISLFSYGKNITPSVPVLLIVILIFVVPKDPTHGFQNLGLLTWEEANSKAHWGVVLVICSGLTLAEASKVSGLSAILVDHLRALKALPSYVVVSILCFAASILTEFTSNAAVSVITLPIVLEMAVALEVHPLYFAIPVAIACSFSFMLPAATPPNAIVYEMGKFKISDMVAPGFIMNMACVTVELISIHTMGPLASPGFLMNTVCVTAELINIHPLESLLFGVYNYSARAAQNRTETPAPSG
ncbi:Na(+)/citrate cotransporter-like [Rhipicephalus microplus]|uniref:Na(+)/citrate cotransporter-like n=1 Tax=Rhipicephalus microplus TaxID=6941 RepID=UPI003F6D3932